MAQDCEVNVTFNVKRWLRVGGHILLSTCWGSGPEQDAKPQIWAEMYVPLIWSEALENISGYASKLLLVHVVAVEQHLYHDVKWDNNSLNLSWSCCVVLGVRLFFIFLFSLSCVFIWPALNHAQKRKQKNSYLLSSTSALVLRTVVVKWISVAPWGTLNCCVHETIATALSPSTQNLTASWHRPHQQILFTCRWFLIPICNKRQPMLRNLLMEQQFFSDSVNKATSSWIAGFFLLQGSRFTKL